MGLLECASGNSLWRGYDYHKNGKVSSIEQISDDIYDALVEGSGVNKYNVLLDVEHPRKSKCNCPHADGKRIICKHIVAAYFTVYPAEADRIYKEAMEYQEEEDKRQEKIMNDLPKCIHKMSKAKLEKLILDLLYSGPEWQYDRFVRYYFDE